MLQCCYIIFQSSCHDIDSSTKGKEPYIIKLKKSYPQLGISAEVTGELIEDESNKLRINQQKFLVFSQYFQINTDTNIFYSSNYLIL